MKKLIGKLKNGNWETLVITIFAGLLCSGCASIVSKSNWPVMISSSPGDAVVAVKDSSGVQIMQVRTPSTLLLKSGSGYFCSAEYIFEFSKEGYEPQSVILKSNVNGWYMGNLLFGGLIGFFIVDPLTGAMYELPPMVFANLPEKAIAQKQVPPPSVPPQEVKKSIPEKTEESVNMPEKENHE